MKHVFKSTYAVLALVTIGIDVTQMVLFLKLKMSGLKETLDDTTMSILATLAQYMLCLLNVLALRYFFQRGDFSDYMRKIFRHEFTYMFLVSTQRADDARFLL